MSDDLTQAIQEATELVKASKKADKKQKSSENMNRYRIFRVEVDEKTGRLKEVNSIERRNVLPNQHRVIQRQSQWDPGWNLDATQYRHNYILMNI